MKFKMHTKGFIAVIAVIMISLFVLTYSYVVMESAVTYADSVARKEWRIQANINAESCLSTVALMATKDYFLEGNVSVSELGCQATVSRNHVQGIIFVRTHTTFNRVSSGIFNQDFIII